MSEGAITVREVVRLLWKADSYPCRNEEWAVAARHGTSCACKGRAAVASPDDSPEFARWLKKLQRRDLSVNEREEIY